MLFVTYQLYSEPGEGVPVQRHRAGAVHPALLPVLGAVRAARRRPRQGAADPHHQARRNRHHARRRRRHHARQHPADARRGVRDGRPLDLLRADQICDPAAASAQGRSARRDRAGRGRHLYRDPARDDPCRHARQLARRRRAGRRSCSRCSAISPAARCRRRRRRPSAFRSTGTSSGPRSTLVSATMHIPRLFLAILSISFFWTIGAVLIIIFPPLVKNVLGANEQVASLFIGIFSVGIAIGSVLINRLAQERGFGALRAGLGDRDGRVRACSCASSPDRGTSIWTRHLTTLEQFPAASDGRADDRRAARRRHHRRHVRRPALRLPDHHRAQDRDRTHGRRQQHRQFGRDGDRLAAWPSG